jgi:hypothetical protein
LVLTDQSERSLRNTDDPQDSAAVDAMYQIISTTRTH